MDLEEMKVAHAAAVGWDKLWQGKQIAVYQQPLADHAVQDEQFCPYSGIVVETVELAGEQDCPFAQVVPCSLTIAGRHQNLHDSYFSVLVVKNKKGSININY